MDTAERLLREHRVIAVVGASRDPSKAAHAIPSQLKIAGGFTIIPINPEAQMLFGEQVYKTLEEVPVPVDIVLVFRPSKDVPPIAKSAVKIGAKALWLQQGIVSEEASRIAREAGLDFVEDECSGVVRSLHRIRKQSETVQV
jgi:predicted CoA-binding protein